MPNTKFTLCWDCARSTDGSCNWSKDFQTVEGWGTEEFKTGILVTWCPEFKRNSWGFGVYRTREEYIKAKINAMQAKRKREKRLEREKNEQVGYYR